MISIGFKTSRSVDIVENHRLYKHLHQSSRTALPKTCSLVLRRKPPAEARLSAKTALSPQTGVLPTPLSSKAILVVAVQAFCSHHVAPLAPSACEASVCSAKNTLMVWVNTSVLRPIPWVLRFDCTDGTVTGTPYRQQPWVLHGSLGTASLGSWGTL